VAAAPRPIVTFLSDFGAGSGYAAQMKGEVLRVLPEAVLVDLSHDVPPFDVLAGALLLEACVPRFPLHAVHVAVVDPGVGTPRRPLCVVDGEGRRLVGPDNGLFTPFLGPRARSQLLATPGVVPAPASATFHGRDLFAPVAAWLAGGGLPEALGPVVDDPVRLAWPFADRVGEEIRGVCLAPDAFGNVATSVRAADLAGAAVVEVRAGGRSLPFVRTFGDVGRGEAAALLGSGGRMEIAVREGHAARELPLARGTPVVVRVAS
jgi:S-adenosylmethionine hydrolase